MDKFIDTLRHPQVWSVSVQLLILYCVSVVLFFTVDRGNLSAADAMKAGVKAGKVPHQIGVFALAASSNALAVLTFVFICKHLNEVPRLAMVGLPLVLIVEKHVRAIRTDQDRKRLELLLATGVTIGIIGAVLTLMHDSPIK